MPSFAALRERHGFLLSFLAINTLAGVSVGVAKIATSLYALHLAAGPGLLALIAGAQSAGVLLMSMPLGILVDQVGPLRLFVFGSLAGGVLYLLTPLLPDPYFLALTALLISACMPCRFVSMNAVFMQQIERLGVAKAGWFRGSHTVGMFLVGPSLAVSIIAVLHFAGTYALIAALFVLTASIAPRVMKHYRPSEGRRLGLRSVIAQFGLLRHEPELREISLIEFTAQATMQYYSFFIVVIALQRYGFSPAAAAGLVTAQGAFFVLSLFVLGHWLQRSGQRRFYLTSFAILIVALTALGFSQSALLLWPAAALLGLGLGMLQTVNISRFARIGARLGRGSVAGINAFVGPAGGLVGSVLGGWLGARFGLQSTFLLCAPLFAGFAVRLWLDERNTHTDVLPSASSAGASKD
ncbi:MFS transporter [Niveibacterium sp. SC-1]|uniref:MFS transporter n=1 Tax=Niveibacterium sp. SC-1 TaxID=3135646 RepID=UPI00311E7301